ncbi:AAA-like domain-containing protein [Cylindrospermopsis raciborskii]|uniref:AAA-like domain-containing protein n=1 Tax=Cylindrospermopsis raciborskii TaxID=77022 RepID=UPI001BA96D60|nr:AAA-like domain-containing protein [Cylindrospermopsis raciborskii]
MKRELFERIYEEELTPIQRRILHRILQGKSNTAIRGDVTVWFDHKVYSGSERDKLPRSKRTILEGLESGKKLMDQSNLSHHLRKICEQFELIDLQEVIKQFIKYRRQLVSYETLEQFELLQTTQFTSGATNSLYYEYRHPIEEKCESYIKKVGEEAILLRIKAPAQMGKTSLINRLLHHEYIKIIKAKVVYINLDDADEKVLNKDMFYRWFCANVSNQLGLDINDCLEIQWKPFLGNNVNCTNIFDKYIFPGCQNIILLGIDNLHRIFPQPELQDFLLWLRTRHENAKNNQIWRKLAFILAYSTDGYPLFQLNYSSLYNLGYSQTLREFNEEEIQNLSLKHGLKWEFSQVKSLQKIIGGHPFLVRLAMYHISHEEMTLKEILNKAATNEGIYSNHLGRLLKIIRDSHLTESLKKVISSSTLVQLDPIETFQLYSIGLVTKKDNKVEPRCQLYREYFTTFI